MATTNQVMFLKSLQKYEEGLNSLVKHYNEIASKPDAGGKIQVASEAAAHIYNLVRKDVTNIIKAYRHIMGA
jgi:hypothetical protein